MATANANVGPKTLGNGADTVLRAGRSAELVVTELHGRYYETAYNQKLFYATAAAKIFSVAATAWTGLGVWNSSNQTGNGVNLAINKVNVGVIATSATMTGIAIGYNAQPAAPTTTTAASSTGCSFLSAAVGSGIAYVVGTTLSAQTVIYQLMHNTAAIATTGEDAINVDLEGSIIVPPGYFVGLFATGAASAAAAVNASMMWEEIAV